MFFRALLDQGHFQYFQKVKAKAFSEIFGMRSSNIIPYPQGSYLHSPIGTEIANVMYAALADSFELGGLLLVK